MRLTIAFLPLIGGLCLLPAVIRAQTITRGEFLEQLQRVHPVFEMEELSSRIESEELSSLSGAEDWNILSSLSLSHEEPAIAIASPEKTDAIAFEGGVERTFWKTGGRLSATYSTYRASFDIDPVFGIPDLFYQNQVALTYAHPLLRNRNGFLDRLRHDLKEYDVEFSQVQSLENREDFLARSAQQFMDWVFLTEQKRIVQERLRLSEEELDRTNRKREANLVEKADVIRAEDAVRFWKQEQMLIESHWKSLQAELAVLTMNDELYNLVPEYPLYQVSEQLALAEEVEQLKADSRLIQALDIRLRQTRYSRRGYENTARPDLSIVTQVNVKNAEEDYPGSFKMDKPDAMIGLRFSYPLGNRLTKHKIAKTDLEIAKLQKALEDMTLTLVAQLTDIHIQLEELTKVLDLNREQIESARERTAEELKLYNQGRGELTFVIQSRDNEQNAKLLYASNALTYQKLRIAYQALMDQLYD